MPIILKGGWDALWGMLIAFPLNLWSHVRLTYRTISLIGEVEVEFDSSSNQAESDFDINKLNLLGQARRHWGRARLVSLDGNCQQWFGCRQKWLNGLMSR